MSLDIEVQETKEFKDAKKCMGEKNVREFLKRDTDDLKKLIADNKVYTQEATQKVKINSAYRDACVIKSDFECSLRATKKPLDIASSLAAILIRDRKVKDDS